MAITTKAVKVAKPAKVTKAAPADPGDFLRRRINSYQLNRLRFEFALAESTAVELSGSEEEDKGVEGRRRAAVSGMEADHLEATARRSPPKTIIGCAELLRVAEQILTGTRR